MSENFNLEIISPDQLILKTEATEVTIPSYEGLMGILKNHIPIITFLRPGLVVVNEKNTEKKFYIEDGIVEFSSNTLILLTSTIKILDSLNKEIVEKMIKNSEEKILKNEINDKEKYILSYKIATLKEISV
jgi:ATP synthase F1 epsilon subunit